LKAVGKTKTGSGSNERKKSQWCYLDHLRFLTRNATVQNVISSSDLTPALIEEVEECSLENENLLDVIKVQHN